MTSPAKRSLRLGRWLGLTVIAAASALSSSARAEEPTIDEVRYHPTELPPDGTRGRTLLTGALLTAGWYGVAVGTSYLFPNAPNARDLRIPVAGPWMALRNVGCGEAERDCREAVLVLRTLLGVLSGVGQAGGLFAITEGLFLETGSAPGKAPRERAPSAAARPARSWVAVPVALPDGAGLELVGRF